MALKGLATQAEIASFKTAIEEMAGNLSAHVNHSLSKAHAVELVHGFVDGSGNDLRLYRDSGGNVISGSDVTKANFVRFFIGGVAYYAPCQYPSPDPGPQAASTGAISLPSTVPTGPASTALVTDYVTDETQGAINVNSLLLGHSRQLEASAHTSLVIVPTPVISTGGDVIANFRLRIPFKGNVYEIPVDPSIGGPGQTPRNLAMSMSPNDGTFALQGGGFYQHTIHFYPGHQFGEGGYYNSGVIYTVIATGAAPLTFKFSFYNVAVFGDSIIPAANDSNWALCPAGTTVGVGGSGHSNSIISWSISGGSLHNFGVGTVNVVPDTSIWFKCVVSNTVGSATVYFKLRMFETT